MKPPPTEDELRKLRSIETTRKQVVLLVTAGIPLLFLISWFIQHETASIVLAVIALLISLSGVVYISFLLRCPRCKGWISMPKCPACGLALDKTTKP
jgi:uncharacterized membrane protein HdeD (DUF308 family)